MSKKNIMNTSIIVIVIVLIGLLYNFIQTKNSIKSNSVTNSYPNGYGIILTNESGKQLDNINLIANDKQFNCNLKFINNEENDKFKLIVLIDYKQVQFITENHINNIYTFSLNKQQEKNIPIKINTDGYKDGTHVLNFIVYNNVNKIVHNYKESFNFDQITSTHNLIIKDKNVDITKPSLTFNDIGYKSSVNTLLLNIDKNSINDNSTKALQIYAKPDETVTLPVTVGGINNKYDYIFFLTLNYNQIILNNNNYYWYFKLKEGYAITKNVTFKAPHNKGTYQLTGFLSLNPWVKQGTNNSGLVISSSRINLIVR